MKFVVVLGVVLGGLWSQGSLAQEVQGCGSLQNAYGPYDYTDAVARRDRLRVVESYHFTSQVEALIRGQSGDLVTDIDYTLRAFPNHHRALAAISRYELNGGKKWPNPAVQSAQCYFRRAVAFAPDDAGARVLFGNYLLKIDKRDDAREQYEQALELAPESPDIAYNAGLFFLEVGDVPRAEKLAAIAYEMGYPLPGLRNRLDAAREAGGGTAQ